jgi:hypothetical protein
MAAWNVLATSHEGRRDTLLIALRRLGRFRRGGYRNVLVGQVDDHAEFLGRVRDGLGDSGTPSPAGDTMLRGSLAKIVPIDATVRLEPATALDVLAEAIVPFVDRLPADRFFVRVERRGLKGRLHTPTIERALGDRVWRTLEARGRVPRVDFADPDAILVVETIGDEAGIGLLSRELRAEFPFVRVR